MGKKRTQTIPEARSLAENLAVTILRDSYRNERGEYGVKDVLLFGSALRGEPANDIDMLAIHDHGPLRKFGFATIYNPKTGKMDFDPSANIQTGFYAPNAILKSMGGENILDDSHLSIVIDEIWEAQRRQYPNLRVPDHQSTEKPEFSDHQYKGALDLPCIEKVEFTEPVVLDRLMEKVNVLVHERLESRMVATKVRAMMEKRGLEVNYALDLHAMDVGLLTPGKMQNERYNVIAQCKDPTFWYTVLTSGRLYDRDSAKFEIPIDRKYNGAAMLFPH